MDYKVVRRVSVGLCEECQQNYFIEKLIINQIVRITRLDKEQVGSST